MSREELLAELAGIVRRKPIPRVEYVNEALERGYGCVAPDCGCPEARLCMFPGNTPHNVD